MRTAAAWHSTHKIWEHHHGRSLADKPGSPGSCLARLFSRWPPLCMRIATNIRPDGYSWCGEVPLSHRGVPCGGLEISSQAVPWRASNGEKDVQTRIPPRCV